MHSTTLFDPHIAQAYTAARTLPRWQRGWAVMQACRSMLLRHGWQVAMLCVAMSSLLWLFRVSLPLWGQLAYSVPMGMVTWALIDGGRFFIDQDSPHLFPRGWRAAALILGGVFTGFVVGTLIGDAVNGFTSFDLVRRSPEFFAFVFLFSMASGIGISLFFYSQGKSAYYQAELEAKSRQATEAQLKLLQSQLDPHMLFNTLANLRALIPHEPERAVQMLDQLGDFLRATLSASRTQEHSLQAEFDRLRDYLSLMQIRLGERLRFQFDLPPELSQIKVPTLILQSLVENAIVHGLEPKVGGGQISITASQEAGFLVLRVSDDGMGCEPTSPPSHTTNGFGLAQVRERLNSKYDGRATIDLVALCAVSTPVNDGFSSKNTTNRADAVSTPGCQATLRLPLHL
ncbi:histidine kinase [Variovorax sp. PCZ-1]|uniref:sensor histidine kinase n=1 Tax=Variovorax sp. PCZ-1 TaxID=2835533 RepID=UPI001BCF9E9C|nr:histidine kinase [Variovorax sp. PCZ-1]MBS7806724.1 histidine kinase [Variovorax sp. PCZ-1]